MLEKITFATLSVRKSHFKFILWKKFFMVSRMPEHQKSGAMERTPIPGIDNFS